VNSFVNPNQKIGDGFIDIIDIIDIIDQRFHDDSYCFIKNTEKARFLVLCGRMHQETITVSEFQNRLETHIDQYGQRADQARQNKGLDFKALSHAVRCLDQMEELIVTGQIRFPLKTADRLREIKAGKYGFDEIEAMINQGIDRVKEQLENLESNTQDRKFIDDFILRAYGEG
jgi:hypothetical protein